MKILNAVDVKKFHGYDNISIWMLKICGASIGCPFEIIFKNSLNHAKLSKVWKKTNITPPQQHVGLL